MMIITRHDKLTEAPDWDRAPDWARYAARDNDMRWFWHEVEPAPGSMVWIRPYNPMGTLTKIAPAETVMTFAYPADMDWRDTLVPRPLPGDAHQYTPEGMRPGDNRRVWLMFLASGGVLFLLAAALLRLFGVA